MGREKSMKRGKARRLDAANAKVIAAIKIIAFVHGHSNALLPNLEATF